MAEKEWLARKEKIAKKSKISWILWIRRFCDAKTDAIPFFQDFSRFSSILGLGLDIGSL